MATVDRSPLAADRSGINDIEMGKVRNDSAPGTADDRFIRVTTNAINQELEEFDIANKAALEGRSVLFGWGVLQWYFGECRCPPNSGYVEATFETVDVFYATTGRLVSCTATLLLQCIWSCCSEHVKCIADCTLDCIYRYKNSRNALLQGPYGSALLSLWIVTTEKSLRSVCITACWSAAWLEY